MSNILLDGESLFDACRAIELTKAHAMDPSALDDLTNIVYAIILWDDAYIMPESFNSLMLSGVGYFNQFGTDFRILPKWKLSSETSNLLNIHFFDNIPEEDIYYSNGLRSCNFKHRDKKRALAYLLAANETGMDYLPSQTRISLLEEIDYQNFFQRKDVLSKLDSHLSAFYEQINATIGRTSVSYRFPVLLDYMLSRCRNIEDIIDYAFSLKYAPSVVRFRQELDSLNEAFKSGDLLAVRDYFESIQGVVDDISKSKNFHKSMDVTISFPPALTFSLDVPSKRPNQLIFIKKLANYGIKHRQPYRNQ